VPPPMDLVAEPEESLADRVTRQRARADKMMASDPQFLALRNHQVIELKPTGNANGNGSDGDDTAG